jgi:hypothetical protein
MKSRLFVLTKNNIAGLKWNTHWLEARKCKQGAGKQQLQFETP